MVYIFADRMKSGKRYTVFHGIGAGKAQIGYAFSFVDTKNDELTGVAVGA